MEQENPTYYAIIPADVRYDKDLSDREKLLYGEITALCNKTGECWAGNEYFANLYNVSISSIKRSISNLVKKGYLQRRLIYKNKSKEVEKRILTLGSNLTLPSVQICTHPGVKNDPDNNTSINNININNMGKKSSKLLREKSDDSDFFELSVEEKTKKVEEYCKEKNYTIDVDYFVDYYETTNWHQRNGKKVVNWKLAVCSWANKSYNKNQKNDSSSPSRLAKPQDDYVHYEQVSDYDYVDNIFKEKGITEKEFYDKIEQWKISVYNETGEFVIGNPPDDIIRKILNKEI